MECEMCGKKVGTRRYMVDGVVMNLGLECSRFGTALDQPAPAGTQAAVQQGLEKRAARAAPRDIFQSNEMVLVEDFGKRIQAARERKGLTKEQLGNKVSARVPEITHIEAGKLRPGDDLTHRLEKELGIQLREAVAAQPQAGPKAKGPGSLTIGDLLRDALDKGK